MKLTIINSVRTNNFNDSFLIQKITRLWKESSNRLTNKEIITYAVYHNYESNYKGDYSLSIAIEDNNGEPSLEIPNNAKYEIFNVDTAVENGVVNTWKEIWERENAGTLERIYKYDFEKYYPNGEIEVYIAIK
ncbi:GyrI-like domain-containing protein [Bacillus paranthracis]|uniref:GyrI-like domain-containing protein n=1 Tax=Bacillus cereus group TaxID=86661 RepID=UPI0006A8B0C3|nr:MULTISPECIES: effector binding domain-containing protein [Bacillus cereus group]EMA6342169.1 effector binding domain-containing protein [Bacillus cytotoxicus]MBL3845208.1 effector binding domain-containing protein [Bacillus cereus]MDA1893664.1 effector binding domain-containing protein [Bacillus cereus group sp. BY11-1LC]MDA2589448.1 effector binding domain-containing protein [Bacillus cereus group sp. Bc065]MDK7440770.1 effector binding domain-containing protein [Bacillus paranthracis]